MTEIEGYLETIEPELKVLTGIFGFPERPEILFMFPKNDFITFIILQSDTGSTRKMTSESDVDKSVDSVDINHKYHT